ncbi:ABC transporter ATP-binding protein YtrB [Rubripirellula lacrimiformis]|uniref:ABC transporter ATP-binding protein YtrB n=1 Tax=Rubripirellula lacrimiformis TaxID=1930273 RepID=A0A517N5G1_9BACT|nr:ABC transporter ATP-binding protein [Rubripirellula lacrimiformis]QDT02364.1 ABC transporter ATP-binding protein YtrB [Rubripirellula lacrimiformis]
MKRIESEEISHALKKQSCPAIDVENLRKSYKDVVAVNGLSLKVEPGETFGLLGPNGAGKSSTIRMLVGLTSPDSGKIKLFDEPAGFQTVSMKQRIGYVPEQHLMYRWMTVREIMEFVKAFYPRWDESLCDELIDLFDLPFNRKVQGLSKGMTSKLGLVIALSTRPEILILDEPTSGLDPLIRDEFLEGILRTQSDETRTVLFSSHHVDDVERLADRIGIMHRGQLILNEKVERLRSEAVQVNLVLRDGSLPRWRPTEVVYEHLQRREWTVTLFPFREELVDAIRSRNPVRSVECSEIGIEQLFKQVIRGNQLSENESIDHA